MALTVGVGTVMDAREVIIVITGAHKAMALANCIEEGVNHMYTVSALQMHPHPMIVCDDDATLELKVKTVKVAPFRGSRLTFSISRVSSLCKNKFKSPGAMLKRPCRAGG
jgi:glucosamine-6-phosphate deaminase